MQFDCPRPAALTAISAPGCSVNFDQITRAFFQLKQTSPVDLSDPDDMFTAATWATLFTASNATKVVKTPRFAGMVIPQSEGRFVGGNDNGSIDGVASYAGEGTVDVSGQLFGLSSTVAGEIKALSQFSLPEATPGLTIYLVNRNGEIICGPGGAGIRIYNLRISSVGSQGLNAKNIHNFSFTLPEGWDEGLLVLSPADDASFKPLEV